MCVVRCSCERLQFRPTMARVRGKGERGQRRLATSRPQSGASANPVRQRESLQRVLHACAHPDPLIAVQQQRTQITQLGRRHPDRREAILRQQFQEQRRVSPIVLLSAGLAPSDLGRITDVAGDAKFLHQPQKPSHRSGRFDADHDRRAAGRRRSPAPSSLRASTFSRRFLPCRDPTSQSFVALRANRSRSSASRPPSTRAL